MVEPIIIKKYSNRRLYHTGNKCYITLEQVASVIKDGDEVQVIDNQIKKDITQETLLQIILAKSHGLFSISLLHQLIRLREDSLQEFLQFYLGAGLEYFIKFKQQMAQQFNFWNQFMMPPIVPPMFQNGTDAKDQSKKGTQLTDIEKSLAEYKQKIQELEKQLHKSQRKGM